MGFSLVFFFCYCCFHEFFTLFFFFLFFVDVSFSFSFFLTPTHTPFNTHTTDQSSPTSHSRPLMTVQLRISQISLPFTANFNNTTPMNATQKNLNVFKKFTASTIHLPLTTIKSSFARYHYLTLQAVFQPGANAYLLGL